ncbi:unnamed protein product [Candidula unifasciata]|uniref:Aquaporin n=1 Tax=Candidula unifasciata TaxID=100452 RepID=A0A8S4A2F3_9EUPU|nr:unnamed protein product [Candidula unifasciata]
MSSTRCWSTYYNNAYTVKNSINTRMKEVDKLHVFFGLHELNTVKFYKAVVCEFLATALLIVFVCGAAVTMDSGRSLSIYTGAFNGAMAVAYIVWTFNHVSGAHINPAVTLSFFVTGHVSVTKTVAYIIAQCGGSVAGAALTWVLVPRAWRGNLASTTFSDEITLAQGFAVEAISTFTMILGIFASSDQYRTDHAGSLPLTVGLIVYTQVAWAGHLTGCSMNPARTLGPAVMAGTWDNHWVYWVAPLVGAVAAGLLYQHVLAESPKRADLSIQIDATVSSTATATEDLKFNDGTTGVKSNQIFGSVKEGFDNPSLQFDHKA